MPRLSLHAALVSAVFVAISFGAASAQSGRRPPARRPDPPPTATPAPEPPVPEKPPVADAGPKIPVSVGKFVMTFDLPSNLCDYVVQACLDRFRSATNFSVLAGKDQNRKAAIDQAKASTDTYVLYMEFSVDSSDPMYVSARDLRSVIVAYSLLEPKTGKTKKAGRVYFDAYSYYSGQPRIPGVRTTRGYSPVEAGQKVADDVMNALVLQSPTSIPVPR